MDHVTGKSRKSFGVSNHRGMSRWFEKIPWQAGDKPICVVIMEFGHEHDDMTNGLSHVAAQQATNHALARYDVIIYVFRLRSQVGQYGGNRCKMCQTQIWSAKYIQNERILWDSLLSVSEEEKVADLSWGETGKVEDFPVSCRGDVTGLSRICRERHGEVGIM